MTDDIHPAVRAAFAPLRDAFEEACEQARREWPWVEGDALDRVIATENAIRERATRAMAEGTEWVRREGLA